MPREGVVAVALVLLAAYVSPLRCALESELEAQGWDVRVVSSGGVDGLVASVVREHPDVVLVDPGAFPSRVSVFQELARRIDPVPTLALVPSGDEAGFIAAIEGGAQGGVVVDHPAAADGALRAALARRVAIPR